MASVSVRVHSLPWLSIFYFFKVRQKFKDIHLSFYFNFNDFIIESCYNSLLICLFSLSLSTMFNLVYTEKKPCLFNSIFIGLHNI